MNKVAERDIVQSGEFWLFFELLVAFCLCHFVFFSKSGFKMDKETKSWFPVTYLPFQLYSCVLYNNNFTGMLPIETFELELQEKVFFIKLNINTQQEGHNIAELLKF